MSSSNSSTGGGSGGAPGKLERAELVLYKPVTSGLFVKRGGKKGSPIKFQFNPESVVLSKGIHVEHHKCVSATTTGPVEFMGLEYGVLDLEMLFDASDTHDDKVVKSVEQLLACCTPVDEKKPFPVVVAFHWGAITSFPAIVKKVSVTYKLFTPAGVPIRAVAKVTLEEIPDEPQKTNPTSGGLAARRAHTVVDGDTLASVAFSEYDRADLWRQLAAYNEIDDPMSLTHGQMLLLPTADELLRGGHLAG